MALHWAARQGRLATRLVLALGADEHALELVVSVLCRQRLALGDGFDDGPESVGILASLLRQLDVALELTCSQNLAHALTVPICRGP
jgi:hypothetical protein